MFFTFLNRWKGPKNLIQLFIKQPGSGLRWNLWLPAGLTAGTYSQKISKTHKFWLSAIFVANRTGVLFRTAQGSKKLTQFSKCKNTLSKPNNLAFKIFLVCWDIQTKHFQNKQHINKLEPFDSNNKICVRIKSNSSTINMDKMNSKTTKTFLGNYQKFFTSPKLRWPISRYYEGQYLTPLKISMDNYESKKV